MKVKIKSKGGKGILKNTKLINNRPWAYENLNPALMLAWQRYFDNLDSY